MTTSDRQLPVRASKACAALRVTAESYSIFNSPCLYSDLHQPVGAILKELRPRVLWRR